MKNMNDESLTLLLLKWLFFFNVQNPARQGRVINQTSASPDNKSNIQVVAFLWENPLEISERKGTMSRVTSCESLKVVNIIRANKVLSRSQCLMSMIHDDAKLENKLHAIDNNLQKTFQTKIIIFKVKNDARELCLRT